MRVRPAPRLRARTRDRSLYRKLLSLRCDPGQYSTLLWPPAMCNRSCIRQELACYIKGGQEKAGKPQETRDIEGESEGETQ